MICLLALGVAIGGCAGSGYVAEDPFDSQVYDHSIYGLICEECGREFSCSSYDYANSENIQCVFCGHNQNLKEAHRRYKELKEREKRQEEALRLRE